MTKTTWTVILASLGVFMTALDTLVVTTSLPALRLDLHASLQSLEWTVNAYNLAFACLLLTGAALGDRFGRRRMYAWPVPLHRRVGRGRALAQRRRAGRRARSAGRGRRDRLPAHADADQRGLPRREARRGHRPVGRDQRPRCRPRPGRRRRHRQRHQLALDLLAQRADRHRAGPPRAHAADRELRPARADRRRRPRPGGRRDARRHLGPRAGERRRLGEPRGRCDAGRRGRLARGSS
jgi:hypothetical protein